MFSITYDIMSSKSETVYRATFQHLAAGCLQNVVVGVVMADFERGLRNAILGVFPNADLRGSFFHYAKTYISLVSSSFIE